MITLAVNLSIMAEFTQFGLPKSKYGKPNKKK